MSARSCFETPFWDDPMAWPADTEHFVFLASAVDRVGGLRGPELPLVDRRSWAAVEIASAYSRGSLHGCLKAAVGGREEALSAHGWDHWRREGELEAVFAGYPVRIDFCESAWVYVSYSDLSKLIETLRSRLALLAATSTAPVQPQPKSVSKWIWSAEAQRDAQEWLRKKARRITTDSMADALFAVWHRNGWQDRKRDYFRQSLANKRDKA